MVVFDDPIACHFGETILPMNLTLADVFGCTGKEFIANNIAAEDTVGRILYTLPVRWPTDMELVSTAATAVAIRYYKLDAGKAKVAFSFAATNATDPGNAYYDYSQNSNITMRKAHAAHYVGRAGKRRWRGLEDPFFGNAGLTQKCGRNLADLYEKAFDELGKNISPRYGLNAAGRHAYNSDGGAWNEAA